MALLTAVKVRRTYATLASDDFSANLKLTPNEQEFMVMLAPEAFAPVSGAWGRQGWTMVTLSAVERDELAAILEMAWRHGAVR